jgi:hypothetical protein
MYETSFRAAPPPPPQISSESVRWFRRWTARRMVATVAIRIYFVHSTQRLV